MDSGNKRCIGAQKTLCVYYWLSVSTKVLKRLANYAPKKGYGRACQGHIEPRYRPTRSGQAPRRNLVGSILTYTRADKEPVCFKLEPIFIGSGEVGWDPVSARPKPITGGDEGGCWEAGWGVFSCERGECHSNWLRDQQWTQGQRQCQEIRQLRDKSF